MFNYQTLKKIFLPAICVMLAMVIFCGCEKAFNLNPPKQDPIAVFEELWSFMDKHYPMFALKGVDWDKIHQQFKSQVKPEMTEAQLFGVLNQMLLNLKDGHVTLFSKKDTATYIDFYKNFPLNFNLNNITTNYLNNDFITTGPIIYKKVNNIGYLYYSSFSKNITESDLDKIFAYLNNTKGLIIDVRSNSGGSPLNADKLFSRFIAQKTLVKYEVIKSGPNHNEFFEPKPFYLSPYGQTYNKPIILLTNRLCFSACNDFALYISLLPNAQIMGNPTGGGAGLPYNYILANGFKLQYSGTYTVYPKKESIENGIQPNRNINFEPQDEANGKDIILETAFDALN